MEWEASTFYALTDFISSLSGKISFDFFTHRDHVTFLESTINDFKRDGLSTERLKKALERQEASGSDLMVVEGMCPFGKTVFRFKKELKGVSKSFTVHHDAEDLLKVSKVRGKKADLTLMFHPDPKVDHTTLQFVTARSTITRSIRKAEKDVKDMTLSLEIERLLGVDYFHTFEASKALWKDLFKELEKVDGIVSVTLNGDEGVIFYHQKGGHFPEEIKVTMPFERLMVFQTTKEPETSSFWLGDLYRTIKNLFELWDEKRESDFFNISIKGGEYPLKLEATLGDLELILFLAVARDETFTDFADDDDLDEF